MNNQRQIRRRKSHAHRVTRDHSLLPWWFLYVLFVVYGSLVPLDFHPQPWANAWTMFMDINMLNIGVQGRADWIANGVLYVPVGFLTVTLLTKENKALGLAVIGSLLFSYALALAVEFTQLFFPPRTVSLNDLIAEFIGGTLGAILAIRGAVRFRSFYSTLMGKPERLAAHLLKAYVLAYIAFSLFPYDFVLSLPELSGKLNSDKWGWLIAQDAWTRGALRWAKLFVELLATLPLGWLFMQQTRHRATLVPVFFAGMLLGLAIEMAQFFVVSGVAQGISVLTRTLGMLGGAMLWQRRASLHFSTLAVALRRHTVAIAVLYMIALAAIHGWFDHRWLDWESASYTLSQVRFLPFYYHYYTTEQAALLSLSAVCLMYAPIGILTWASWFSATWAMLLGVSAAAVIETSKLFLQNQHPDPTNLFLAAFAAWLTATLLQRLAKASVLSEDNQRATIDKNLTSPSQTSAENKVQRGATGLPLSQAEDQTRQTPHGLSVRAYLLLGGGAIGVIWGIFSYPIHSPLLGLFLGGYAVLLWYKPQFLFLAIPAALPTLDFSPWSGRFFFDEYDMLLIVSLVVGYLRMPSASVRIRNPIFMVATMLLGASFVIGIVRGFLPWQAPDLNSFNHYYSPYNSLRIAKGVLWALLIYGLWQRSTERLKIRYLFAWGMVVGLIVTVAVVIWERAAFPGLFNFTDVYRVMGSFSQMHIGGAELETYLTLAIPFTIVLIFLYRHWAIRLLGGVILIGATYAMMVTFSRIGYLAYAISLALVLLTTLISRDSNVVISTKQSMGVFVWVLLSGAMAWSIIVTPFAQERISKIGTDLAIRQTHWTDALNMRDPGLVTSLLGMGLGRYPETHYWRSEETRAATYRLGVESGNTFLRLGSGNALYLEQFVSIQPQQKYTLDMRVRSVQSSHLKVALCEKWLLTSARCNFQTVNITGDGRWHAVQLVMLSGEIGNAMGYIERPVKFSIFNPSIQTVVDVDRASLRAADGKALLGNEDFSMGSDLWFFSVDNDKPWHIWSLPITLIFDLGWFGLLTFSFFVLVGLTQIAQDIRHKDAISGAVLAACIGFLVIGSMGSLIDNPRMLFLFLLLVFIGTSSRPLQKRINSPTLRPI